MMAGDENIKMSITELTINKRTKPFAQGAMRIAAYARTSSSTNRFVVKSFKKNGKRLAHLAEDLRVQALCKCLTLEYNALLGEQHSLDFIVTTCLRGKRSSGLDQEHLSLEPFIEGTYVKYNNNTNWVNKDSPDDPINQAAQAFSHFTFERSQGQFLVSDLQGVRNLLTDPAIHTRDAERFKLSDTNLGEEGFKFFFSAHECNDFCRKLQLKSNRAMFISGTFEYRDSWPSMDNVVCCSNKLCGKILRLSSSKKSSDFPGHHWCDECYPQLHPTMIELMCVAPGPHHVFQASKFFYESQGRNPPRLCPDHRGEDTALFRPEFNASTAVISAQWRSIPQRHTEPPREESASVPAEVLELPRTPAYKPAAPRSAPAPVPAPYVYTPVRYEPAPARYETVNAPYVAPVRRHQPAPTPYMAAPAPFESIRLPYEPFEDDSPTTTRRRGEHRFDDPTASRTSVASGGFWSKIKSVSRRRSMSLKPSNSRLVKRP
jgi:hypothetical protein